MDFNKIKANKKLLILLIAAAVLIIAAAGALIFYHSGLSAAEPGNDEAITVEIPAGSGASTIIDILDENGLVKNKTAAKLHVRLGGYDSLQANTYIFNRGMSLKEILSAINTGDFNYLSKNQLTIIEASTIPQAAESLAGKLNISAEDILAVWNDREYLRTLIDRYWFLTDEILAEGIMFPLEGYLYPETYIITDSEPSIEYVTEMILDYTDGVLSERRADIEATGMSVHEFLSLAAVVESESLFAEDRPIIAGVFYNRLEQGMPLQSDSTVLYALQEKHIDVTYEDLAVESPYNTYKYAGLPIGPVCAVSAPCIDDVIAYDDNDYLYFFAKEDGTVIYSRTYAEHEQAVSENLWY